MPTPAAIIALLLCLAAPAPAWQAQGVLHIKVTLVDADGTASPVARHALLISDNPSSAPPRRIVTTLEGTATVRLRPGNYTVESDQPVAFQGKAYHWTQVLDIVAGRDAVLELSAGNAEVEAVSAGTPEASADTDPSFLLPRWRDSVVAVWTPTTHASAFVVDARGLLVTNQRGIGAATAVETQVTPEIKVPAVVLAADRVHDVAVLWVDAKAIASVRPLPMDCGTTPAPLAAGEEIFTIGTPLRGYKRMTSGIVSRVDAHVILSDVAVPSGSAGGPVFSTGGALVGLTLAVSDSGDGRRGSSRAVPIADACSLFASAETKMSTASPPGAEHLPVDPVRPFPAEALPAAVRGRAGSLKPYSVPASDFDVAFITPVLIYGAQTPAGRASGRERPPSPDGPGVEQSFVRPLMDFGAWSEYVESFPPVLLVRVTPKMVEGFWTKVARGALWTQGVSLPSIKHFKAGFSHLRAYCGEREVTPIHPFKLELRVSEGDVIYEGLYAFDPDALGPQCGAVRIELYSEKETRKADARVVDPAVVQQIWQDFAPYRAGAGPARLR